MQQLFVKGFDSKNITLNFDNNDAIIGQTLLQKVAEVFFLKLSDFYIKCGNVYYFSIFA